MSNGRILILAREDEPHIPYVTRHLAEDEFLLVDTKQILSDGHLTYWTGSHGSEVLYRGEPIGPVRSVWSREFSFGLALNATAFRKTIQDPANEAAANLARHELFYAMIGDINSHYWPERIPVDAKFQEYCRSALDRLSLALGYFYPEAFWISRREAVVRSSHKPLQLKLAQECGFKVPETMITSDPEAARAFLERLGECVAKPLSVSPPEGLDQPTKVLNADNPPDFSGLKFAPQIFQELVRPAAELRVTGMGPLTFAAEVGDADAATEQNRGVFDWRRGFDKETFFARPYDLPASFKEMHVDFLRRADLVNGMTDVIVNQDGELVYLETNPGGAWGFVEHATGFPMGQTQAELLRSAGQWNVPQWARQFM